MTRFSRKVFLDIKAMKMRNKLKALMTAVLLSLSVTSLAEPVLLDRVVAIVEDDIVLHSELQARVAQVRENMERAGETLPPSGELHRDILDLLIVESIQLQMAERAGLRISDDQLNQAMARIAAQNNMTLPEFQNALAATGTNYQTAREQVKREMVLQQVQQGNVSQRIQITSQEVRNWLGSEEGKLRTAPEYHLSQALIEVPSNANDAQQDAAMAQARTLAQKVKQGAELVATAREMGFGASDLGWRSQLDLPSLFADIVPDMSDGEVSAPFTSASGIHVIHLLETTGRRRFVTQTEASHILLKPSAIRDEEQTQALAQELRSRAANGETFAKLAKEYSEDIGSAQEGGDLGWTTPGQLVPEFQEAMNNTDEGAISDPFKSRYGYHIVKVRDRREKDITDDLHERLARNAIHQRKFKEELDIWLRKIRDEAYIDIKL